MPLDDDSSDESQSDSVSEADDADLRSTTSLEDMSRLTANMLLYKAARARNVTVMLDALSQSADVNWKNDDDYGRTPLMQAIFSVCVHCHCVIASVFSDCSFDYKAFFIGFSSSLVLTSKLPLLHSKYSPTFRTYSSWSGHLGS